MRSAPDASPSGPMYTITTHRPWTTLITLNIETAEVGAWLTPAHLVGRPSPFAPASGWSDNPTFPSSVSCGTAWARTGAGPLRWTRRWTPPSVSAWSGLEMPPQWGTILVSVILGSSTRRSTRSRWRSRRRRGRMGYHPTPVDHTCDFGVRSTGRSVSTGNFSGQARTAASRSRLASGA